MFEIQSPGEMVVLWLIVNFCSPPVIKINRPAISKRLSSAVKVALRRDVVVDLALDRDPGGRVPDDVLSHPDVLHRARRDRPALVADRPDDRRPALPVPPGPIEEIPLAVGVDCAFELEEIFHVDAARSGPPERQSRHSGRL